MFRWYQNAQVCYAYLSDVPAIEGLDHYRKDSEFRQSKWFTRGWTLQELLAPEVVVFYNHDWIEIGAKASMDVLVSSITNIEALLLAGAFDVYAACAAQKMSWASKRKTTRLEDMAYCLMGLFDVHMPLLYGEGKKSFYRLQLEIIRESSDESIFAWGHAAPNRVPPKILQSRFYGLLAEDPGPFQGSGDVVATYSFRPPYTMTNKGLQIGVTLVQRPNIQFVPNSPENDWRYPKWILSLHCRRRRDESKVLAIYLVEGEEGRGWARVSDLLLSSPHSPRGNVHEQIEWRQIIIQASHNEHTPSLSTYYSPAYFLDVRSVMKYCYSACLQMDDDEQLELGKAGTTIIQLEPIYTRFRLSLECKTHRDNFGLVLTRCPANWTRREDFFDITSDDNKPNPLNDYRPLIPCCGEVAKVIMKRKAVSGKPIHVVEILIE